MSTLLRPSQRTALEQDLRAAEAALNDPQIAPYIQEKATARKQAQALKAALDRDAPKPYESAQAKDAAMLRERELREEIKVGMLSVEEMRRNRTGSGSVHKHRMWEKANKSKIKEWKEIKLRLEPDSEDPDLTNFERYRPERPFMMDTTAQIPGVHAMSPQAKENWPLGDPKADTAVSHIKKGQGK